MFNVVSCNTECSNDSNKAPQNLHSWTEGHNTSDVRDLDQEDLLSSLNANMVCKWLCLFNFLSIHNSLSAVCLSMANVVYVVVLLSQTAHNFNIHTLKSH